ncbi:GNAT family N-acetyltransferase [Ectobacillus polymachus]|uniref:GNAT family N-acetyltransferase n=1 Tax=Ectobacillus polymachus TaxID=1508806 RepID=UPI003A871F60
MNIRVVETKEQMQQAFAIRKLVFVNEQKVTAEEEYDEFDSIATHVVLYDKGVPVGTGRFRILDDYGKLERICILSSERGKGAGRLIMEKLENLAAKEGLQKVKLHAQTHAEEFYKKLGYETKSDVFLEADIPHVLMTKELSTLDK